MFPFVMPFETSGTSVADASGWLERPAGGRGFVRVRDGHFYLGESGPRIRFWGTNLAFGGNFPTHEDAPLLAAKLARFGTNVVRIHSADAIDGRPSFIDRSVSDTQHLSREYLERFDYFVAELKKRGIYVNLNLHVNRNFTAADGVTEAEQLPAYGKNVTLFDRQLIELQKKYAHDLLSHKNPYTGNDYAHEPAVACVEITNENSFFYGWYSGKLDNLPPHYAKQLDEAFRKYLREKYKSTSFVAAGWKGSLPPLQYLERGNISRPAFSETTRTRECIDDYLSCLWQIEHDYFEEMHGYLKRDCGVQMPITGTMFFTLNGGAIQSMTQDFVDMHAYWQHPEFKADWKGKWTIKNTPLVDEPVKNSLTWLASARVAGKPFTVSEFNEPWPNFYDAEAIPLVATWAARQDWDGVYLFNFNGNGEFRRKKVYSFFDIDGHPVKTAQMIAGAAIFARGDVPEASFVDTGSVGPMEGSRIVGSKFSWSQGEAALEALNRSFAGSLNRRWELLISGWPGLAPCDMDTRNWHDDDAKPATWKPGPLTLRTSRSLVAVGDLTSAPVTLNGITISAPGLPTRFAAITMTALDSSGTSDSAAFGEHQRFLLIAAGRTQNTNMKWDADFHSAYDGMGEGPVLTEGIPATIKLPESMTGARVTALDESGMRGRSVPMAKANSFAIGPEYKTIWYLVERSR